MDPIRLVASLASTPNRAAATPRSKSAPALFGGTSTLRHHLQFTFANLKGDFSVRSRNGSDEADDGVSARSRSSRRRDLGRLEGVGEQSDSSRD
jgi:hypothetical protein